MGRKRKPESAHLPKYVYLAKGRYIYKPYLGKGEFGQEIVLASGDAPLSKVHREHERAQGQGEYTLKWLIKKYLGSKQFYEKADRTQKDHKYYAENLFKQPLANGQLFADVRLSTINQRTIRKYLDTKEAKVTANKHVKFLKTVFSWGRERYANVKTNPCVGVKLYSEPHRERYIEDWEYELLLNSSTSEYIPVFMEIAYLCRARWSEIATLKHDNVREDGVFLKRTKGSKNELTLWSPRLREAVQKAQNFNRLRFSHHLIHDKDGSPIRYSAFQSAWRRLMLKALSNGLEERFTFHDIKAKGVSDHEIKFSGHKTERMKHVYDRKLAEVKSTK